MKRCPECRRDYYDETLLYCLDDGERLLEGPASVDEPVTAIISPHETEPATRVFERLAANAPAPPKAPATAPTRNSLIAGALGLLLITALGVGSYLYFGRGSAAQIESIAVMPFVNESGNADIEYLSDGMTETLIKSL